MEKIESHFVNQIEYKIIKLLGRGKGGYSYLAEKAKSSGLNIDYFPTNFVVTKNPKVGTEKIFYIDYECNDYMEEWNFENWGIKYWSKTKEFLDYISKNN